MPRYQSSLREGLVGAWCPGVSGSGGLLLPDLSGNGNHGTLTNMDPATDWVTSNGYYGFDIDVTNDLIDCGTGIAREINGRTQFSFSAWIVLRSGGGGGFGRLFEFGSVNSNALPATTTSAVSIATSGGTLSCSQSSFTALNALTHFCGSFFIGNSVNIFRNGIATTTSPVVSSGTFNVGVNSLIIGNRSIANRALDGIVFDLRFFNRLLHESEIRQLYEGGPGYGLRPERRRHYYFPSTTTNRRRRIICGAPV